MIPSRRTLHVTGETRRGSRAESSAAEQPTVALLPWGDLWEDYLDPLGLSLDSFQREMTGGWLFGYVEALARAGIRTSIMCFTALVQTAERRIHEPTGASLWLLPASPLYRRLRRRVRDAYASSLDGMFGPSRGARRLSHAAMRELLPFLATPVATLRRALSAERADVILCQEYEYARFDVAVLAGRLERIPVFATFQGGAPSGRRLEALTRPRALNACAGLVVATKAEAARLSARGVPPSKLARVFNPLDASLWGTVPRAEARRRLGIPEDARVAIWHGRVDFASKGVDVLAKAWRTVAQNTANSRLILIGSGPDAARLAALVEGQPSVRRLDRFLLDRSELEAHLCAADVYAFPSLHEGFPVAPLEAMACRLPVVAARTPGIEDVLEAGEASGGVLVPAGEAEPMSAALGRYLGSPELAAAVGRNGRATIESRFAPVEVGRALREFLVEGAAGA